MLTEKEKMQRAKLYMQKLALGINPIDDSSIEKDSALQNKRLAKCFMYISEVLDNNINNTDNSKSTTKKYVKKTFEITEQEINTINILPKDCVISELADEINKAVKENNCKKLASKTINDWLVEKGYLRNAEYGNGKTRRELTAKSSEIGITSKQGIGSFGSFTIIMYSEKAQQYILDNLMEIASFAK